MMIKHEVWPLVGVKVEGVEDVSAPGNLCKVHLKKHQGDAHLLKIWVGHAVIEGVC